MISSAGDSRISSVPPLKARPSTPRRFAAQRPQRGAHFLKESLFLQLVDLFHFLEQAEVDAQLLRDIAEGRDIFGKAGASVADAGAQEAPADPLVQPHSARHLLDIRVHCLAEIGDHIDERNLHGQKCIRGVLDDLRRLGRGLQERAGDRRRTGRREPRRNARSSCLK